MIFDVIKHSWLSMIYINFKIVEVPIYLFFFDVIKYNRHKNKSKKIVKCKREHCA